jgi:hypothetical protein
MYVVLNYKIGHRRPEIASLSPGLKRIVMTDNVSVAFRMVMNCPEAPDFEIATDSE